MDIPAAPLMLPGMSHNVVCKDITETSTYCAPSAKRHCSDAAHISCPCTYSSICPIINLSIIHPPFYPSPIHPSSYPFIYSLMAVCAQAAVCLVGPSSWAPTPLSTCPSSPPMTSWRWPFPPCRPPSRPKPSALSSTFGASCPCRLMPAWSES